MSALSVFALRLAAGMIACLLLLSPADVNPRFYRVHFLTALGLTGLAAVFVRDGRRLAAVDAAPRRHGPGAGRLRLLVLWRRRRAGGR